MSISEANL